MATKTKTSESAVSYFAFLKNVNKARSLASAPGMDAEEEALLNELALAWFKGTPYAVREAMGLDKLASPSTLHRRISRLKVLGMIQDAPFSGNQRVKLLVPTAKTMAY